MGMAPGAALLIIGLVLVIVALVVAGVPPMLLWVGVAVAVVGLVLVVVAVVRTRR